MNLSKEFDKYKICKFCKQEFKFDKNQELIPCCDGQKNIEEPEDDKTIEKQNKVYNDQCPVMYKDAHLRQFTDEINGDKNLLEYVTNIQTKFKIGIPYHL